MRRICCAFAMLMCVCFLLAGRAETLCGIYAAVDHPEKGIVVIHENGCLEEYGDAGDLPENSISFGYASLLTRYSLRDDNLISSEGLVFSFSPELTWRGKTYMRIDQCPFFPTSAQLAASGLMWQNDQIGNLTFEKNGTVHSDENADGTYDNGLLRIGGCEYLVQRSVWSDGIGDEYWLTDQTLVLYQIENGESTDRLLLVAEDE